MADARKALEWLLRDAVRQHYYDLHAKGDKPDDPGWHRCRCGWQGYWCDYEPHVAERIAEALIEERAVVHLADLAGVDLDV